MLGLRSGEARALRWIDVDFTAGIVHVNRSVGETRSGLIIGEPKTKRSIRKLPAGHVVNLLAQHKIAQDSHAAMIGTAWTNNGLVCPNQSGGIMSRSQPYWGVKGIVRKHKELPLGLHPHSLRHSFVSMLISQGVDIVHVASLAGDTVPVIAKVYAHAFAEREAAAMNAIGNVFAQINSTPMPLLITENA